ncbi:hypothetical protein [uncultured Maribacter sp.]|uniref:tetratricopeptide repeat protein n=1 Tax=uncultured Maribacter sp. TaxID=431308 RepID=UPI002615537C|nr:hypothetical protein [uncultured Maribacter sp.]
MKLKNKILFINLLILSSYNLYASPIFFQKKHQKDSTKYYTRQIKKVFGKEYTNLQESQRILKESLAFFNAKKDTNKIIQCYLLLSNLQTKKGNYSKSFDYLWDAKNMSSNNSKTLQVNSRLMLARLYDEFNMTKLALANTEEALKISKSSSNYNTTISSYMYLAVRQRTSGNYKKALKYLDSCLTVNSKSSTKNFEMPFWDAEHGILLQKLGQYKESQRYLHKARNATKHLNIDYRPYISMYLGDLKQSQKQLDSAALYYKESLKLIHNLGLKNDKEIYTLDKLAQVYKKRGNIRVAYNYMEEARTLESKKIAIKNRTISELFEIKSTYLKDIFEKDAKLEQQNLLIEKNEQIQFRLKVILGLLILLSIVSYTFIQMRLKLKKTLLDKKEAQIKAESIKKKSENEIELKSKELTSYALQLVDKDSAIDELLDVLKTETSQKYKNLYYKYKKGSKDLWDDFNMQFTSINSAFYNKLETLHPKLSVTEQKHCALIKLNLGTKEMARILNIEAHSVHVSRSRIRKKIGLQRSENLEKYIASL